MSEKKVNIDLIEKNIDKLEKSRIEAIEKEIRDIEKVKEEKILEKRILELEQEIEAIKKFLAEDGLNIKMKEAKAKLEKAKNAKKLETFKGKPTLVDFWAAWCAPCQFIERTIHEIKDKYKDDINIVQIDTETELGNELYFEYAEKFGVNAIPFLLLFDKDGNCVDQLIGADPNKLKEMVANVMGQ
ncbi:MAG: thioredoxin domain-containing protein [Candidatus Helarchaeota archaeon]